MNDEEEEEDRVTHKKMKKKKKKRRKKGDDKNYLNIIGRRLREVFTVNSTSIHAMTQIYEYVEQGTVKVWCYKSVPLFTVPCI